MGVEPRREDFGDDCLDEFSRGVEGPGPVSPGFSVFVGQEATEEWNLRFKIGSLCGQQFNRWQGGHPVFLERAHDVGKVGHGIRRYPEQALRA